MGFKVGKEKLITRTVTVKEPVDDEFLDHRMKVKMNLLTISQEEAARKKLIDAKTTDLQGDLFKKFIVRGIEDGPEDEEGKPYSVEEALDILWVREAIVSDYVATSQGIRRKN